MDSVKTDEELTSTVGNVLSTSKEEKNDSSDATPTSSTDANTNPKASQTVSDDPISSTSSDTFDQSKTTDMKPSVDEPDRAQTEDHVGDLLEMRAPNEKITEDVEDLVHDLESLLGEPQEAFNLPSTKNANCKGDASASVKTDEKNDNEDKVEEIENTIDDTITDTVSNLADTKDINSKENTESNLNSVLPCIGENSSTDKDNLEISEITEESNNADADKDATSKSVDQTTCEQTSQIDPIDPAVAVSTHKIETTNPPVDEDSDSIGSWEMVDSEAISPITGPSGEPIEAPIITNTAEDITSSEDKASSTETNKENEENREAESVQSEQQDVNEAPDIKDQSKQLVSDQAPDKNGDEIREAEPSEFNDLTKEAEAATSSQTKEEIEAESGKTGNADASQNVESPVEITSSEVGSKSETEIQETTVKDDLEAAPIEPSEPEVESGPSVSSENDETKPTEADNNVDTKDTIIENVEEDPKDAETEKTDIVEGSESLKDAHLVETVPKSEGQDKNTTNEAMSATKTDVAEEQVMRIEKQEDVTEVNATQVEEDLKSDGIEAKSLQVEAEHVMPIEEQEDVTEVNATQVEEDLKSDGIEAKSMQVEEHVIPIQEQEDVTEIDATQVEEDLKSDGIEAKSMQVEEEHVMPIQEQEDVTEDNTTQVEEAIKSDGIEEKSLQVEEQHVMPIEKQEDVIEENATQVEEDVKSENIEEKSLQVEEEHVMPIEKQEDVIEENATQVEEDVKSDCIEEKSLQVEEKHVMPIEKQDVTEEHATQVEEDVKSDGIEEKSLQVEDEHVIPIEKQEDVTEENATQVEEDVKSDGIEAKTLQVEEEHVPIEEQEDVTEENATQVEEDVKSDGLEAKSLQVEEENVMPTEKQDVTEENATQVEEDLKSDGIEAITLQVEDHVMEIEEQENVTEENSTLVEKDVKSNDSEVKSLQVVEEDSKRDKTEEKAMTVEEHAAKTPAIEENVMQVEEEEDAKRVAAEEITPEVEAEDSASPKSEQCDPSSEVKRSESTETEKESSAITNIDETSEVDVSNPVENEGCSEESSNITENQENEHLNEAESNLKPVDEVEVQNKNEELVAVTEKVESKTVELQKESPTEDLLQLKASDDVDVEEKHKKPVENEDDDNNESSKEATDAAKDVSEEIAAEEESKKVLEANQELKDESTVPATEPEKKFHKENSMINKETETVSEKVDPKPILERKHSHLAELEFAPLQLSEDDSDDSEPVPILALEPDDSNSPAVAEINELPSEDIAEIQPVEEIEDKPIYVQPVVQPVAVMRHVQPIVPQTRGVSGNQLVVSMAGCLQKIDGFKHPESERIVSEKERKEMEALALAIQSITDNSNSYMDEYMEPIVEDNLQYEANLQEVIQEEAVIEPLVSQEEVAIDGPIDQEDIAIEPPIDQEEIAIEPPIDQKEIAIEPSVCQEEAAIEPSICQEEAAIEPSVCQEEAAIEASVCQKASVIETSVRQEESAIEASVRQEELATEASVDQKEVAIEPPVSQEPDSVVESQKVESSENIEESKKETVSSQSNIEITSTQETEFVIPAEIQTQETKTVIPAEVQESQVQEEHKIDLDAAVLKSTEMDQDKPSEAKNENKIEQVEEEKDQKANEVVKEEAKEVTAKNDKEAEEKSKVIVEEEDKEVVAKEVKEAIVEEAKKVEVESVSQIAEKTVSKTIQEKVSDVDVVLKENASQSSEISQDSANEVLSKEGKRTRSNDKYKKHKKADKYEELSINVDVPDKEITYSPKITIKPIKMHDDEVSTTTSSECEVFKGSLKMTITKQSHKMHSILKISDQDNSEAASEQDEPIPKLIIKPKMQQVENQHSPKMSTRSSKVSPTVSNQRSGSPRITIKPLAKPDKQEPVSPLKIKINTKANVKASSKEEEAVTRKVSIKLVKSIDELEQVQSPRITIKPIPKPDSEKEVANPRLTIKPIRKPEEDVENEDKERSSPKIVIKTVIKPQESDISHTEEEDGVKERIVLKINKGNLPSPVKESKKREHPPDDDKSEKLAKITVKFSKGGGHPHIVHQQGEDTPKRSHEDNPSNSEKNKKQKIDAEVVVSTRSSARHKEQVEASDKSSPSSEAKAKHKEHHAQESPIETKRPRKDNLNDKSKLLKDDISEELLSIDTKVDSPIVISEDSRSQDSSSVILLDEGKDDSVSSDTIRTPDSTKSIHKAVALDTGSATPSPVLKRGRGRPRKVPTSVLEEPKPSIDESPKLKQHHPQSKESDASPAPQTPVQARESGRPKRSCRGQSVCDTLGIKPRKPRGGGRGRGSKRGMGSRLVAERDPSAENASEEEVKVEVKVEVKEESDKSSEIIDKKYPNTSKIDVVVIEDEPNPKNTKKPNTKRKSIEKKVETDIPVIEIDSGDSQLSEKEPETNKDVSKKSDDNVEPMDVDDNDKEVEIITKNPKIEGSVAIPSTSSDQEATTLDDKRAILKDIGILEEKPIDIEDKEVEQKTIAEDDTAIAFQSLAPPSTPKDFSELDSQIIESSLACKPSKQDIPSVSSTTGSSEIMIVDEETRMSAETNSRAQTPAKQVITSSDIVEESQSSVHSTATTESGKTPSRPSKAPRLEVQEPESQIMTAELLSEYYWNGNGPFMLQEQVAQFLGIKSFKRKYPGIMRRMLDMQERDFIREKSLASEHMCDLGLTAVNSADILDIMYSDFQEKYEEYCKHQRDRQAKELINKQKALSLATSQEKSKADITEQAVHSAAQWNARFNKERKEQRKACMDLQNFTVHYPKGKKSSPVTNPHPGNYPVALVPGQFAEYYKEFTPTELNNLPINTMGYEEVHFIPREVSDESGSESDSDSSSSSGSSSCSSSDSDSSSGIEDCKLCKHSPKKSPATMTPLSPHSPKKPPAAVAPMSPPPAVAPPLATAK